MHHSNFKRVLMRAKSDLLLLLFEVISTIDLSSMCLYNSLLGFTVIYAYFVKVLRWRG